MYWLDFFICFFSGFLGVHKFREGKTGLGFLYLFTIGIFGMGWIIDSFKYLIRAISNAKNTDIPDLSKHMSHGKHRGLRTTILIVSLVFLIIVGVSCTQDPSGEKDRTDPQSEIIEATEESSASTSPAFTPTPEATPTPTPEPTLVPATTASATTIAAAVETTEAPTEATILESDYVLNTNTMKFHKPDCSSVEDILPKNRLDVHCTRDEIIADDYVPCKRCNP